MKFFVRVELLSPYRVVNKLVDGASNPLSAIKTALIEEGIVKCSEIDYEKVSSATVTVIEEHRRVAP